MTSHQITFPNLVKIIFARSFIDRTNEKIFQYEKNNLEKIGSIVRFPLEEIMHFVVKNRAEPLLIVALTLLTGTIVTICFYHVQVHGFLVTLLPFFKNLSPWMLKMATYLLLQITILGIGIRAMGRVTNHQLMQKYKKNELICLYPGSRIKKLKV